MGYLRDRLIGTIHKEDCCCCGDCDCEHENNHQEEHLSEEEIEQIINEKYSEKDDKTKAFIRKGLKRWGDKYKYTKTKFIDKYTLVTIWCPIHGFFEKRAGEFLLQRTTCGCPKCSIELRTSKNTKTREEFISQSLMRWGSKFDYSKVIYVNSDTPVEIICPIHGSFLIRPRLFLSMRENNFGCPSCGRDSTRKKLMSNTKSFVLKAIKKFGNKFSYDKVDYVDENTPVIITCKEHGDFLKTPREFFNSLYGCPICSNKLKSEQLRLDREEFINRAIEVHGPLYCYDYVDYKGLTVPVKIFDPQRNEYFYQKPTVHLNGSGNPKRTLSRGEQLVMTWIEELGYDYDPQYKVVIPNIGLIRVDFCLYFKNIPIFIEYNGRQHYESVPRFENRRSFKDQVKRDVGLIDYCNINHIKLIMIPYTISGYTNISDFLTKTIIENIDPHALIDYDSLYVFDDNST